MKTEFRILIGVLFLLSSFAYGVSDEVVASIGKSRVTTNDLREELSRKGGTVTATTLEDLLDKKIKFELMYAAALQEGIDQEPTVVEAIRQMVVDRYLMTHLGPELAAVAVQAAEVEAYYKAGSERFVTLPAIRAAIIRISVSSRASEVKRNELRERALQAREEALALPPTQHSFGGVAVTYSDDQTTRYRGGEIGWLEGEGRANWEPELIAALHSLDEPLTVSPVIETESGFYLVKLMETRPSRLRSLDEVRPQVTHELFREKSEAVRSELFDRLKEDIAVEVYAERLGMLLAEVETAQHEPPHLPN